MLQGVYSSLFQNSAVTTASAGDGQKKNNNQNGQNHATVTAEGHDGHFSLKCLFEMPSKPTSPACVNSHHCPLDSVLPVPDSVGFNTSV